MFCLSFVGKVVESVLAFLQNAHRSAQTEAPVLAGLCRSGRVLPVAEAVVVAAATTVVIDAASEIHTVAAGRP